MRGILLLLLLVFSFAGAVWGQTVQRGVVREYNERAAKTPLAGVELRAAGAGSTVSGKDGEFALEFLTLEPGQRVNVRRIEKEGYVLFNKEAVEQWNLSPTTPFVLVMCRSDRFKRIRDNYYRNSEERYAAQYKKERDELARLQKEGKLKDEEYRKRLAEVSDNYERQLDNLDAYVDRFARIDLSEISGVEQEIIELVEAGRFDEAVQKYEDLRIKEQLVEALGQRKEVRNAIKQLSAVESGMSASIDSLYAAAERQIATLRLAGGVENNRKILAIYREIADADSSRTQWLQMTAEAVSNITADYALAMHYLKQALRNVAETSGERSADACHILIETGNLLRLQADYASALEVYEKARAILETETEHKGQDKSALYNNMGLALMESGKNSEALDYLKKALEQCEGSANPDYRRISAIYNNLGITYDKLGDYAQAIDYHTRTLELRKRTLPAGSAELVSSYNNLGAAYSALESYDKALENYREALAISEREFGTGHPDTGQLYLNIGVVQYSKGQYAEALESYGKALDILKKSLGEEHPIVAVCLANIGRVHYKTGKPEKATEVHSEALEIQRKIYGETHPDIAQSYLGLANAHIAMGDTATAHAHLSRAQICAEKAVGTEHPITATVFNNLAYLYELEGQPGEALNHNLKALAIRRRILPATHTDIGSSYNNTGQSYYLLGDYPRAIEYKSLALPIFEAAGQTKMVTDISNSIREMYAVQGNYEAAIPFGLKALRGLERQFGADSGECAMQHGIVGFHYMHMKQTAEALEHLTITRDIFAQLYGADSGEVKRLEDLMRTLRGE